MSGIASVHQGTAMALPPEIEARASTGCELCGAAGPLAGHDVGAAGAPSDDATSRMIAVCGACGPQLPSDATLTPTSLFGLQESIWSDVAAVQVASFRLLKRLSQESWARDLLDQCYLDPSVAAWAAAGEGEGDAGPDDALVFVDSNGTVLSAGDTVTLIKDLNVKGANFTAKRGTTVKNIRLTDDPEHIEGRVNKVSIYLKTCFLKKLS